VCTALVCRAGRGQPVWPELYAWAVHEQASGYKDLVIT
jgi:hypothetical protein